MASTIQVRVDDELKIKSDRLFKDLGTDTTTAIRMFPLTEKQIMEKLEKARVCEKKGEYRSADDMISDMRQKYGL